LKRTAKRNAELWRERLQREGRWQEYLARLKQLREGKGGLEGLSADMAIMRKEFGYRANGEWDHKTEADEKFLLDRQIQQSKAQKRYRMKKKMSDFEEAFASLENNTAEPAKEMDWVGSHPAMFRKDRGEVDEETEKVLLTGRDLLNPLNGRAPSKRAAIMLQRWVNDPEGFQKATVSEQKKATTSTAEDRDGVEATDDTSEIERMLATLESRVKNG
jgi:hypothetical protein